MHTKREDLKYFTAMYPHKAGYRAIKAINKYVIRRENMRCILPKRSILICSQLTPIPNIAKPNRYPKIKDSRAVLVFDHK